MIVFLLFVDVSRTSGRGLSVNRIDPYVLCTEGKIIVRHGDKNKTLEIHDRENIKENDRIRTLAHSAATIFWPDGSITRLAEQTNVTINELKKWSEISTQVDFSLTEGKTWSNISRYLDPASHFKERFDNDTKIAAVRGTVFEINTNDGYVHTVDHTISIADPNGTIISQVSAGNSVDINNVLQTVMSGALNNAWILQNLTEDQKLTIERVKAAQILLQDYAKQASTIEKIQFILRAFFGIPTGEMPFQVTFDGADAHVVIDPKKLARLGGSDAETVYALYETISGFKNTEGNIDAKIAVRGALEQVLPMVVSKENLTQYQDSFARAAMYESWDSIKLDQPELTKKLRSSIEEYIKNGANAAELKNIQQSLPQSFIDNLNAQIAEWKKNKGFDILSDSEWAAKTFQIDTEGIMNNIKQFNSAIDSLTSGK